MVVKTLRCAFSEKEIYPGHGKCQIRKDGRTLHFIDSKSASLYNQGKKAAKIVWTRNWRVKHKKIKVTRDVRRIKKKTKKVQRAINGLDLQAIASRQSEDWKKERRAKRQKALNSAKQKKGAKGGKVKGKKKKGKR